jgi:hypothetical protein
LTLRKHEDQFNECDRDLRVHELGQRIGNEDAEFMSQFQSCFKFYDEKATQLRHYLSDLGNFESVAKAVQISISAMPAQYGQYVNSRFRGSADYIYQELCELASADLTRLRRARDSLISSIQTCGFSNAPAVTERAEHLSRDYSNALAAARRTLDSALPHQETRWTIDITRANAVEDFVSFANLKYTQYHGTHFRVRYTDEIGIDCGGLTRELFTLVAKPLFKRAFSVADSGDVFWLPNNFECVATRSRDVLAAGFLIRLALEFDERLNIPLPISLFRNLRNEEVTLDDFQMIYPEAVRNLAQIENDLSGGQSSGVFLEDGREVNAELFHEYVTEQIQTSIVKSVARATEIFHRGFHAGGQNELCVLSGNDIWKRIVGPIPIDWEAMKTSCRLVGYSKQDVSVVLFWKIFDELPEESRILMLRFITASDRSPAHGFEDTPIVIRNKNWDGIGKGPIPMAATCFRTLALPEITDESEMRRSINVCVEFAHAFHCH